MSENNSGNQPCNQNQTLGDIQADNGNVAAGLQAGGDIILTQTKIIQISVDEIKTREFVITSPYKGLEKFKPEDSAQFFGRESATSGLVNELEDTNLIVLLGASGSGKSSVVGAGLIPWFQKKWGNRFVSLTLTPNQDPFEGLYVSLVSRGIDPAQAEMARAGQADTLSQAVKELKQPEDFWLIFVDQFEELFTVSTPEKRDRFIEGLVQLSKAQAKNPLIKIIATMRADFLDRLDPYPASLLARATQSHRPLLTQMHPDDLRQAIEQPAAQHGVVFETGLVEEIIKDVQGQAGYLPLLQYTLNLLWESEVQDGGIHDRTLNISSYHQIGKVRGALEKRVEQIYQALDQPNQLAILRNGGMIPPAPDPKIKAGGHTPSSAQLAAQRIFLKLVEIGGDAASGTEWRPVRRRTKRSEFKDAQEQSVLTELINQKLLVSDAGKQAANAASESTIEIAHEILLTSWTTLNTWIQEHRQAIALRNRLNDDVALWQTNRADSDLWDGSKLAQALERRSDPVFQQVLGGFSDTASQFIDASLSLRERQRRRNMLRLSGFLVVASVLAVFATYQWSNAQKQLVSTIGALINNSQELFDSNKKFDALLAGLNAGKQFKTASFGVSPDLQMRIKDALENSIIWTKEQNRLEGHHGAINNLSFSPNGRVLASDSADGTIKLWDVITGKVINTFDKNKIKINGFSFIKDGLLAFDSADDTIKLWDVTASKVINTLNKNEIGIKAVTFSSNGQIASRSADDTIKLWDIATGKIFNTLKTDKHGDRAETIIFSPAGQWLASIVGQWDTVTEDAIFTVWNVTTGKVKNTFKVKSNGFITSISFSPDGELLASAGEDKTIHLWDIATGKEIKTFTGHAGRISSVSFSPDGQMLVSASWDTTIKFWDVATGEEIKTFAGHKTEINSVSFSANGNLLASGSLDGAIKLWDASAQKEVIPFDNHLVGEGISISPDRKLLASTQKAAYVNQEDLIKLWDVATHKEIAILAGHRHWIKSVSFSPDGQWLASAAWDYTIKLWNIRACIETTPCQASETLVLPSSPYVESISFSPDGKLLASAGNVNWGQNNDIQIWDIATHPINPKPIKILQGHKNFISSVRFSPDGKLLASAASDHTIKIWDVDQGIELKTLEGHRDQVNEVSFSPDGQQLVSASNDETIKLWDVATGKEIKTLTEHTGSVSRVIFSPNGKGLVSSSDDNTIKLWDVATGRVTNTLRGHKGIKNLSLSNDGQLLASQSPEQVLLWEVKTLSNLTLEDLMEKGCGWMGSYLKSNPNVSESDRHLCDK